MICNLYKIQITTGKTTNVEDRLKGAEFQITMSKRIFHLSVTAAVSMGMFQRGREMP
jgi:hypothetical protein